MVIFLTRVTYGKNSTSKEDREYRINGKGPVGTLSEYNKIFPDEQFSIKDKINPENDGEVI